MTSSILAVFERVDVSLVERLLAGASGESSLSIVRFANQVSGPTSVPDGEIRAKCRYLFEVKTARNAVSDVQLRSHLALLDGQHGDERLFVLSPDAAIPSLVSVLGDPRVFWLSFRSLSDAVEDLLSDPRELVPEQSRFLLRELQALFKQDGLLDFDDTVVVAARTAWPEYFKYHAYICQPNRSFQRGLRHMAFYTDGSIQPTVPEILGQMDNVRMDEDFAQELLAADRPTDQAIGRVIRQILADTARVAGDVLQIFLLSGPEDGRTLQLKEPVRNAQPSPWTQGQRYTRFEVLEKGPSDTNGLVARG